MKKVIFSLFLLLAGPAFGQSELTDLTVWRHPELAAEKAVPAPAPAPAVAEVEAPERAAPPAGSDKLVATGTVPVIDVAHIAETIRVVENAIEQLQRLNKLRDKANIDLSSLLRIPFVDEENATGAFLEKMLWILGGGHPTLGIVEEETLSYSSLGGIGERFRRFFPGERIVAGQGEASEPSPWEIWQSEADYLGDRYRAMLASLYRTMDIYRLHTEQISRERQGIWAQRRSAGDAEGESQYAQYLLAALHQSLDAESVDRQLRMMGSNTELLLAAEEIDERAGGLAKERAFLAGRRELFSDWQPLAEVKGKRLGL